MFMDGVAGAGCAKAGAAAVTMKRSRMIERFIARKSFAVFMKDWKADVAWTFLNKFEFRRTGRYQDAPLRAVRLRSIQETGANRPATITIAAPRASNVPGRPDQAVPAT